MAAPSALTTDQILEVLLLSQNATAIYNTNDIVIQMANDAMIAFWDKDRSVIGKPLEEAVPELKGQPFIGMLQKVLNTGETIAGQAIPAELLVNGKLQTFYYDFEYRAIKNADGLTYCILHTADDVTERELNRLALEQAHALENEQREAMIESEERFRNMAEESDILIAVGDESSNATYFSKAWVELTGKSLADLLQFGWTERIHPDDRDAYVNTYLTAFEKRVPFTGEFRVLNSDGNYRWLLAKGPPRFRPDGSFAGYISSCVDITDRKTWETNLRDTSEELQAINEELASTNEELVEIQSQLQGETIEKQKAFDRLKANEQNIRNMVRQAPVGMCIIENEPLRVVEVNNTFLEITGKTRHKADTKPYWELVDDYYKPITDKVLATGESYRAYEEELLLVRHGKEETVFVDFVYEPMKDSQGMPYAIMIVAIEVTDKVLARRKVERTEESLRMAISAAASGTYSINTRNMDFIVSPRFKELFGFYPDEEISYQGCIDCIREDYRPTVYTMIEASVTRGERFELEYPVIGFHDGKQRWLRGLGTVQQDSYGVDSFLTGITIDITEQKQDDIRKNDFIGMVSHELKTPLTSLSAIVQVANSKLKKSEDAFLSGAMDKANLQVKRMSNMINGFLNISRLESGKITIDKQHFNVDEVIRDTISEIMITAPTHTITLADCDTVTVFADRDKISSVINNLITNAIKYSPKGQYIDINCKTEDNQVIVSVKDEGMGMKQSDADRIFDRYYRVETKHTQHISGFGIGLYLSAEIIKRHEGKIWVKSESGVGSTFCFSLPL